MDTPAGADSLRSIEEYLARLRKKVDALRSRANLPAFIGSEKEQDQVRLFFMNRAIEIGESCFRIRDLPLPMFLLSRVLCEDFFLLFWVSLSDQNASEYVKTNASEATRMLRVFLTEGRGRLRRKIHRRRRN